MVSIRPMNPRFDVIGNGVANLMLLADILETADSMHRAAGEPTYNPGIHEHDDGTPSCAIAHWFAYKGTTWLDYDVGAEMDEFGLTPSQRLELFGARSCGGARTAQEAAAFIREFATKRSQVDQPAELQLASGGW